MIQVFSHTAESLRREIESRLFNIGILCRVFARGKDKFSLAKKIDANPEKYSLDGKKIQDVIGIRVVLYFSDDIEVVKKILVKNYAYDKESSTIDTPSSNEFSVSRYNLIFGLPERYFGDFGRAISGQPIDKTFEVQIRSVLSEGWHEVDHDLRYKRRTDWADQNDLSRALNGIIATLETAEWSMQSIFEDLSYRHYRAKNWDAMLHSNLRMRMSGSLHAEISEIFNQDNTVAKEFYRIERGRILTNLACMEQAIPINPSNIVYLWNFLSANNESIRELTPPFLSDTFDELKAK